MVSEVADSAPTIHLATRGSLGRVIYGAGISFDVAVATRVLGNDVVVRGPNHKANADLAKRIEAAAGPSKRSNPHTNQGPYVLPHYQPVKRPPEGHTFYETSRRKAAKNP